MASHVDTHTNFPPNGVVWMTCKSRHNFSLVEKECCSCWQTLACSLCRTEILKLPVCPCTLCACSSGLLLFLLPLEAQQASLRGPSLVKASSLPARSSISLPVCSLSSFSALGHHRQHGLFMPFKYKKWPGAWWGYSETGRRIGSAKRTGW